MNQDFLLYLQQVLKEHNLESSLDELAVVCFRYGIEKVEQLEPDIIVGIYNTIQGNRKAQSNNSEGGSSIATLMRQKFNKKVESEAQQIVKDYQNVPIEVQETVIKTMLQQYIQKNPKLDEFLQEADYAKISEENIQHSQKMLKHLMFGLLAVLIILAGCSFVESIGNAFRTEKVIYVKN